MLECISLEIHSIREVLLDLSESVRVVVVQFWCGYDTCRTSGWRERIEIDERLMLNGLQVELLSVNQSKE